MTQEAQTTKNYFRLNGGINTEANELGFPEGFSVDEQNYELLVDGSRRRRKGLTTESGASAAHNVGTFSPPEMHQCFMWRNVGGDPLVDKVVYRKGSQLHFCDADETLSDGWDTGGLSLTPFKTGNATTANTDNTHITFSQGRGRLLVAGQFIEPFYVEYTASTGVYTAYRIELRVRDFGDIEDGIYITSEPDTLTDDHSYNLKNRGFSATEINEYYTDSSNTKYPSKNMRWHAGYKRALTGSSSADPDGVQEWSSAKLDGEAFGKTSAKTGSLFLNPFNTTYGINPDVSAAGYLNIDTWTHSVGPTGYWTITITTASGHGFTEAADAGVSYITIGGNSFDYDFIYRDTPYEWEGVVSASLNGKWLIQSVPDDNVQLTIHIPSLSNGFNGYDNQYKSKGWVDVDVPIARSIGEEHSDSTAAVEWFAGRAFYAGFANEEWSDTVFFSQIVDTPEKFGRCYQSADPTDEQFNEVVPTDGGTIVIPGMGRISNLVATRNALLVMGDDGVWEISGGRGVFDATNYQVRKLTDESCSGPMSILKIENSVVFTGPGGIHIIAPNQYTGLLEVQNAIKMSIQSLWNEYTTSEQEKCQALYDDSKQRAYFWFKDSSGYITSMLVFDAKVSAWWKYTFASGSLLLSGIAIPTADDPSNNKKAKFIYKATAADTVQWADFDQTGFDDANSPTQQQAYMYTGWDNIGDWQRRKQAPIITVFSKRTETGFTASGDEWLPANESSTRMTAFWDWSADDSSLGGDVNEAQTNQSTATPVEVYRHSRRFVPSATTDLDGYPVVVTRNKIRGRGRALQLKFQSDTDKDSHILGFTINYKVTRRK